VFHTASVRADALRRRENGMWPDGPERVMDGGLTVSGIGLRAPLVDLYPVTGLRHQGG